MKFLSALLPIVLTTVVSGHHMVSNMIIDGVDQGMGKCMRIPPNTDPVTNIKSKDMACNVGGIVGQPRACVADVGSEITFIWRSWPDGSVPGSIDQSHKGPCSVYMKKVNDATKSPGWGEGWFKIYHDGYRGGKWCTERIAENGGKMTVRIPANLRGGDYLIRAETLALHQAQTSGGAQWYMGCGQLILNSSGGKARPNTVPIPGYVKSNHPGVLYDLWNPSTQHNNYKIPGPNVFKASPGGNYPMENRKERGNWNCLVENANWCARPVPAFTSEAGCWASVDNCWKQLNQCYNTAPVTGNKGCRKWEEVCSRYQDHCHACGATRSCNGKFPKH